MKHNRRIPRIAHLTNLITLAICAAAMSALAGPLPSGWLDQDIGGVGSAGSASYDAGVFTVSGSGDDIWNNADAFHYVYQSLDGDGEIYFQVVTQDNTDPWAKAGAMIRETLVAGSTHATMAITPGNGTTFQRRTATAGTSEHTTPGDGRTVPYWVRLTRVGNTFTGYKSSDGSAWAQVGAADITMASAVYIGIAVTAHNNTAVSAATIDQVNLVLPQFNPPSITTQPQNQTVDDGSVATFSVVADGSKPLSYQWRFNSAPISGATSNIFQRDPVQSSHAGNYTVAITNSLGSITSSVASLTVITDTTAPTITAAANQGYTSVIVTFSEPVQATTGTNKNNYALNNGASVLSATFGTNTQTVVLTTSTLVNDTTYQLTVNNVRDRSAAGNTIAANTQVTFLLHIEQIRGILREVHQGMDGSLSSLTNNASYPDSPYLSEIITNFFEAPTNFRDYYGQRLRGYIIPPTSGDYVFWIATDDQGALFLSTDDQPAHKTLIANVNGWTAVRAWGTEANQQSAPITLEGGRAYYIEALMSEGNGGDNLAVKWQLPDGSQEEPIPAARLLPWGTVFGPPGIAQHPQNTSAVEGASAIFRVVLNSVGPASFQWQRNSVDIPNANSGSYTNNPVPMADNGALFRCIVSNTLGVTNSNPAQLTVTPDVTRPTLASVQNQGRNSLQVIFSESVNSTAANFANYALSGGISVTGVTLDGDPRVVYLTTGSMTYGASYTLTVNNIQDRAATPNTILPNATLTFTAVEFAPSDIGAPTLPGSTTSVPGGFDVTSSGSAINWTSDQFQFGWQPRDGDFDVQTRVNHLTITDPYVRAGLMAREGLGDNARFGAVFASSPQLGCFLEVRQTAGQAAELLTPPNGSFPVNYPQTWLRLQRSGAFLIGYASLDGITWTSLGSRDFGSLPTRLYFGFAVSSGNSNLLAAAQFRDVGTTASLATGAFTPTREPLGPSSRATGLIVSEIMCHPKARADGRNLEFVEIYNARAIFEDLNGWRISGDIDYRFPEGFKLEAGDAVVIAASPADIAAVYGITNVLGPYTNSLPNDQGHIRLRNNADAVRLDIHYSSDPPWPASADGAGHSLVLTRPSYGEDYPQAWAASERIGGSPGGIDTLYPAEPLPIVINEFLANTEDPGADFLELYNHSNASVNLSGCWLSDDRNTNKFRIPEGTSIAPRGFLSYDQNQLGFSLSSAGETLYLVNSNLTRVLDAVRFGPQETGVSSGRSPDGSATIRRLTSVTPGAANSTWRAADIVINEIMYNPISGDIDDEYVELYNRSGHSVDLTGWKLKGGIDFKFGLGTILSVNSYLVVARNAARLLTNYPALNTNNTVGNFSGSLRNSGEYLALTLPNLTLETNNSGKVITNLNYFVASEVTYGNGGRWAAYADGGGSSLELIDANADTQHAANWMASDESAKSTWTQLSFTGVLDNGNSTYNSDRFFILLQGAGECLVDDVEIYKTPGANLLSNGDFETGLGNWLLAGTHGQSYIQTTGAASGSACLHVVAVGDGDTGLNSIRSPLDAGLSPNDTATIRAKVRWLAGWPEILFRTHGNWIEMASRMAVPKNLGTPGQANSRRIGNAGPAIYGVNHTPALPQNGDTVLVTCRASDPDGIGSIQLRYRVDPNSSYTTVNMVDNGTAGDKISGDGIYSATLPAQGASALIAFRIVAADRAATPASAQFPVKAPAQECLIRWGDSIPFGSFAHYHLWNTQATDRARTNALNNTYQDATLVYGNFRVIYNVGFRDKGSPYHSGGGDYAITVPPDDLLLGIQDRVFGATGNGGAEETCLRGQVANWFAQKLNIPYLHCHYLRLYRNGSQHQNISEDLQQPSMTYAQQWFPEDGSGDLFKAAVWFEFGDDNLSFNPIGATLESFTTTGGQYKLPRYRWNFQLRPSDSANDFTNFLALVSAANDGTTNFVKRLLEVADMDQWMRVFAYHRLMGNWDSWTYNVGQNMFLYKQPGVPWHLMAWDIDFVLGLGDGTGAALWGGQDPIGNKIYDTPAFRRMLWRAFRDGVNGPMLPENYGPQIEARRAILLKNNVGGIAAPTQIYSYVTGRRNYVLSQIAANDAAAFAITNNGGNNYSTASSLTVLEGTAPFDVATIDINGVPHPVTWLDQNRFQVAIALSQAANVLVLTGRDRLGNVLPSRTDSITINYTGTIEKPEDHVVINEIMYHPLIPNIAYVEIHNSSTLNTFDLSYWCLDGVDFDFAPGTLIPANSYLVVVSDEEAFRAAYGATPIIAGQWHGKLQNNGETLRLIIPGATPDLDHLIDEVTYDSAAPWPPLANGLGSSLQLIDPARDNNRVANWAAVTNGGAASLLVTNSLVAIDSWWKYDQTGADKGTTWRNPGYNDSGWSGPGQGLLACETATMPEPIRTTLSVSSSKITFYFRTHFTFTNDPAKTTLYLRTVIDDGAVFYLNGVILGQVGMNTNLPISYLTNATRSVEATYEGSFAFLPGQHQLVNGDNVIAVEVHQTSPTSTDIVFGLSLTSVTEAPTIYSGDPATPGAVNSVKQSLPAFLTLRLNEVQPVNVSGPVDLMGEHDPWVEIHNAGTNSLSLSGLYLSDNYTTLNKWAFPSGANIGPGQFRIVWLDNEPGESTTDEWHANFRLSATAGSVVLAESGANSSAILDYLNYPTINSDRSYGSYPDSRPGGRKAFFYATPGQTNNPASGPAEVYINEWMAANTYTLDDPDEGNLDDYEDWIELYNAANEAVDLSGFTLTDSLNYPSQWTIPDGTIIPAKGFRLVWADNDTGQNSTNSIDLHANFKLSASGEEIGLFAPDGRLVDGVKFGPQTNDISQGRWPDGTPGTNYVFMTTPTPRANNVTANNPPSLNAIGNSSGHEGSLISFVATATDPDAGQTLTFSLAPGAPDGASINASSGLFSWTPTEAQGPSTYSVTIRVTDNGIPNLTNSETITITIAEVNTAPTLDPIPAKSVNEGGLLSFVATANDTDLPAQTLTFSLDEGAPLGAMIDSSTGLFSWTPTENQGPGVYSITIVVTDNGPSPLNASQTFSVTVNEVNVAPVLAAIGNKSGNEMSLITFTATATDADLPAQSLTFTLDNGAPTEASITSGGLFTWTPTEAQGPSTNLVTIRVSDGVTSAFETIQIVVNEVNVAPVLAAIGNKSGNEMSLITFTAIATDADLPAQTLTFTLDNGAPTGASITSGGLFTWTPTEDQGPSTNLVTIRVSDGVTNAFETIQIVVSEVNVAPVLAAIGNKSGNEMSLITFTATATDADLPAQSLTFTLDNGAPTGASITSGGLFTWTPTEDQGPSTNLVTIRVSDGVTSAFETIQIVVNELNVAPVLAAIGNKSGNEMSLITFTATATDADLPTQSLTFTLDNGAPTGASITSGGLFTWTPTEAQGPSTNLVTIRVSDGVTNAFETIQIVVNEVNVAPVLAAIGNKSGNEMSLITFTATATDADLPPQTLTFTLDNGAPTGASITSGGLFTWTPTEAQGPSTNLVTIRVSDGVTNAFESIQIVVNEVNVAPVLAAIGNKSGNEMSLITFTATATDADADLPPQTLTFTLGSGAPTGASITSGGLFTWTPTEAQGPSTNLVTIRVSDGVTNAFETIQIVVSEVNVAPVLSPIEDKTVTVGATLTFTNIAVDADLPAQTLTFSLDPGAPVGASITTNGVFTWTPTSEQSSSTNTIGIRVTDSGSPARSDVKTFRVMVGKPATQMRMTLLFGGSQKLSLEFETQQGVVYQVQYKDNLTGETWQDFNGPIAATNSLERINGLLSTNHHRFYRVKQINAP